MNKVESQDFLMILAIDFTSVNSGLFTDTIQLVFQIKLVQTGKW